MQWAPGTALPKQKSVLDARLIWPMLLLLDLRDDGLVFRAAALGRLRRRKAGISPAGRWTTADVTILASLEMPLPLDLARAQGSAVYARRATACPVVVIDHK
jgi:hypothetical protein